MVMASLGPPSARPLVAHLLTKMDEFQYNN